MARYRALSQGFLAGKRIRAGAVFELPLGLKPGRWMERIEYHEASGDPEPKRRRTPRPKAAPVAAKEPETFSELSKTLGDSIPSEGPGE